MTRLDSAKRQVLLLFDYDWDQIGFQAHSENCQFHGAGFDLFAFPNNARLLNFSVQRFVDQLIAKFGDKLDAVVSNNEQFGALIAALMARKLGLPGTPPEAIIRLQHKYFCRQMIDEVAPQANPRYQLLPNDPKRMLELPLEYPLFIKPIKAAFSVLARQISDRQALAAHLSFGWFEEVIIRRLIRPFDDIAAQFIDQPVGAWNMLAEEVIHAPQFNLDGYVNQGEAHLLGVVDEVMYPGTQAFLRFAYPSKLPHALQQRAFELAKKVLTKAGFTHGMFNMEFFYLAEKDELKIIEFNPRLASQLADLYRKVDGLDVYGINLALALGQDPLKVPRHPSKGSHAASFVFRSFDTQVPRAPSAQGRAWLKASEPEAILMHFVKSKPGLLRELKWLGSHRFGTLNLHGSSEANLIERYRQACSALAWPSPY